MIPAAHPLAEKAAAPGEPLATMDLNELRYEPFVLMDQNLHPALLLRSFCLRRPVRAKHSLRDQQYRRHCRHGSVHSVLRHHPRYYTLGLTEGVACFSLRTVRPGRLPSAARNTAT